MKKLYTKNDLGISFAFTACVMLVAQVVLSLAFSPAYDANGNLPNWAFWLMQGLYSCFVGLAAWAYAKIAKADFVVATTANQKPVFLHVVWGFLTDIFLIAMMLPLNTWILQLLTSITGKTYGVEMPMQVFPMILVACILPALMEEFVFRGTIAQSLKNSKSKLGALAVSGALFALIHLNPAQTLHQFVLGALLTLLMFRSGSVWTSVLVHLFNNLAAVALSFMFVDESALAPYYGWLFAVGLVGLAACVWGYLKTTKSVWTREVLKTELVDCDGEVCDAVEEEWSKQSKIYFGVAVGICGLIWLLMLFV